jgi:hypothetical protein
VPVARAGFQADERTAVEEGEYAPGGQDREGRQNLVYLLGSGLIVVGLLGAVLFWFWLRRSRPVAPMEDKD